MTQARLVVELPDGPWAADVSREFPEATFRVIAGLPGDGPGFALVWITAPEVEAVLEAMESHPSVTETSVVGRADREVTVQFETSAPLLLLAAKRSGVPFEMPVEISDGDAIIDVTGAHDRISELGRQFDDLGLEFRVKHVQERLQASQLLTETEQELLLSAIEEGYYDTPRTCSLTDLADCAGFAKSTCSEALHRAEEVAVKRFAEDLPPQADADEATE
ncbi:helix-turn-helix domain-containing protein [Halorubrum persicum]|uniref:Helix-turn-helix domain-containing protein n=1 Tax=Halorubrum persicum TaxID=1383844 RepID=A0A2G1WMU1_9EURY|nr:helix-turn-helix domain-containing protein [Halorubrum persicum]PHQ40302.1 helix-turn-helix domain-containing protein [Halorubrum persicum]